MSLKEKVVIPNYTLGEELVSAISHGIGILLSIAAIAIAIASYLSPKTIKISGFVLLNKSEIYKLMRKNSNKRMFISSNFYLF